MVQNKLAKATNLIQVKKLEESCDAECKKKCDKDADEMIREMANPLNDITWNCKNNYDVFTTDYDPNHEHMDRMSMDIMDTQKVLDQIKRLEVEVKKPLAVNFSDERDTQRQTLSMLKKELGIPESATSKDFESLNVRQAVYDAVETHAQPDHSNNGFTKAYGLNP